MAEFKRMFSKLFFKYLVSFMTIVFIALLTQMLIVITFLNWQSKQWEKKIFESFSTKVIEETEKSAPTPESFIKLCLELAKKDDKVSGLLFHAENGEVFLSYGFTRTGTVLSSLSPENATAQNSKDLIEDYSEINQNKEARGEKSFKATRVTLPLSVIHIAGKDATITSEFGTLSIPLPADIRGNQISGIIMIVENGTQKLTVDVLTYNIATYSLTRDIFRRFSFILVISALISLAFASMAATWMSKRISRFAIATEGALKQLACGGETLSLSESTSVEQQSINESIIKLSEILSKNERGRKAWLRNISHDLKTPTASLKLLLDGMADGVFPLSLKTVETAQKELGNLIARLGRITTFANLQNLTRSPQMEEFPASILIDTINATFDDNKRLEFHGGQTMLYGNSQSLALALAELVSNSRNATKEKITIFFHDPHTIVIKNPGCLPKGINLFEIWERGDQGRTSGGNGLGLNIAEQVLRLHNGRVTLLQEGPLVVATMSWNPIR